MSGLVWNFACRKEESSTRTAGFQMRLTDETIIDPILDDISKIIAIAQTNSEFCDILLDEAQLDIGMENLVLYFRIKDKVLPTANIPVKKLFADISTSLSLSYDTAWFDCGIVQDLPQLNLILVVTDDEVELSELEIWGLSLVLASTSDFEAEGDHLQTAYDEDLVTYQVSNNIEPEDQAIMEGNTCPRFIVVENHTGLLIVDNNWSLDLNDVDSFNTIWDYNGVVPNQEMEDALDSARTVTNTDIYIPLAVCDYSNTGLISQSGITTLINTYRISGDDDIDLLLGDDCPRDYYQDREEYTQIKVDKYALRRFCKWPRKNCDFDFIASVATMPSAPELKLISYRKFVTRKLVKKDAVRTFIEAPYFFRWDYIEGSHADPYIIKVIGKHPRAGDKHTIALTLGVPYKYVTDPTTTPISTNTITTSISYSYSVTIKDYELGSQYAYYCERIDGLGEEYNLGQVKIWARERN